MGYAGHSEAPKSNVDALINKATSSNFMQVVPNSHFWTDLNQILMCYDTRPDELTNEYLQTGLLNTLKNGYNINGHYEPNPKVVTFFDTVEGMIRYVNHDSYSLSEFINTISNTILKGLNLVGSKNLRRSEVYKRIDAERDYQDLRWNTNIREEDVPDEDKPVAEWLNYIEYHLTKSKLANYHLNKDESLTEIRKVAALAVRALEIHGCPERIVKLDYNPDSTGDTSPLHNIILTSNGTGGTPLTNTLT